MEEVKTMNRQPVAYIRRSAADAGSPGDVSREVQESAVRDLAHRDGFNGDVTYFVDWARSAAEEKTEKRTAYAEMLRRIEAGDVSHVYAYALDRLNRSLLMSARFAKACETADVKVITQREGEVRHDSPDQWLRWTIVATFGEYELRTIKARSASALARRRENGDKLGQAPYGYRTARVDGRIVHVQDDAVDLVRVIDAYREAGSVLGACGLLEAAGVPAPRGGTRWSTSALTRILQREAPEVLPPASARGMRRPASAMLAQLLHCPFCGRMLTPNVKRGQYYCANGARERDTHPRYAVREADVLPWIMAEAERFDPPVDAVEMPADTVGRAELLAKREGIGDSLALGLWTREKAIAERDKIDAALAALDVAEGIVAVPPSIDWDTWPAPDVNRVLRTLFYGIELGPDLLPVGADWRIPSEYIRPV
jgi:DNA invertase Pin-like site-specific DNA recombinase